MPGCRTERGIGCHQHSGAHRGQTDAALPLPLSHSVSLTPSVLLSVVAALARLSSLHQHRPGGDVVSSPQRASGREDKSGGGSARQARQATPTTAVTTTPTTTATTPSREGGGGGGGDTGGGGPGGGERSAVGGGGGGGSGGVAGGGGEAAEKEERPPASESVEPTVAFDVASLVLYGSRALPIRLKILLDLLFNQLPHAQVTRLLAAFGWTYEDYTRGYILQVSRDQFHQTPARWAGE